MKRLYLVIALLFAPAAFAQTAAENIAAGRAALTAHNLPLATSKFQAALTQEPANQTAAALLGIARLFNVTEQSASQTFMNTLGLEAGGREVYDWRASLPSEDEEPVLPTDYNFTQIAAFWQSTLVPESESARANLALVTNPNFLLTLSAAETNMPVAVNVDYADILMARACLRAAEFLAHLGSGQNLNLNLEALLNVMSGDLFSLQRVLADNPDFLAADLTIEGAAAKQAAKQAAKAALQDMIALYRQASTAVRARPAGLNRLFMLDADGLAEEAGFRQMLDTIERSLTEPVELGTGYLYAGPLFESSWSARAVLPTFSATGLDVTSVPDASLGGITTAFTKEKIAAFFANNETTFAEMGWGWVSPKPQGNAMRRYLFLPSGKHLAMGNAGAYLTSLDGSTWTPGRIPGAGQIEGIAVNAGQIVAAGYDGCIYLSTDDAVSWRRVLAGAGAGFHSVAYGDGLFVAVGDYGLTATSPDGEEWNEFYPTGISLLDVMHTGTLFVATGVDENNLNSVILTSADGLNWTQRMNTNIGNAYFWGVAQGGGNVVAVGHSNSRAVSSDGGLTWTTGTALPTGTVTLNDIVYANGLFVAVGASGTIATSPDGVTWTAAASGETFLGLFGVGVSDTTTYVVAAGGVVLASGNNTTFTRSINSFTTAGNITNPNLFALRTIDGELYVGGGTNSATSGVILRSSDGQSFTTVSSGHGDVLDIIKHDSTFYAVGGYSTPTPSATSLVLTSPDGTTWTPQATFNNIVRSISYVHDRLIITGSGGMLRTSTDGSTWTARTTGVGGQLYAAAYGNGVYVAVGGNNAGVCNVITSADGVTWTVRNAGTNQTFRGIVFYQGVFTAVGTDGAIHRSTDGINWWSARSEEINTVLSSITVLDGRYYVTQVAGNIANTMFETQAAVLVSSDGESWVRVPQGTLNTPNRAERFGGRIYTANGGASILRSQVIPPVMAPAIELLTGNSMVPQGGTLALVANVTTDGATTYQWRRFGVDVPGATGPGLTLENLQPGDGAYYDLVVTNAAGTVISGTIDVSISSTPTAPSFLSHPESMTVSNGANVTLSVETSGTAPITYQWVKDGVDVTNGGNVSGATTDTLIITGASAANGGTYTVVAHNSVDDTTSLPAVLTVETAASYYFSTLAGLAGNFGSTNGTGSAARFNNPYGMVADASGNLYVADTNGGSIRKITPAGVVTTVISGTIGSPVGITLVGSTLYFTTAAHVVRSVEIDGSNSVVVAGTVGSAGTADGIGSVARFNNPRGIVADATGENLYVTNANSHSVRKIVLASATVSTFAGSAGNQLGNTNGTGTAARFNSPGGIAIDAAGNLYVADTNNGLVRKITTPGAVVSTYAGLAIGMVDGPLGVGTFSAPTGIAVDSLGRVYVTDTSTIRRISSSQVVSTIGGQAYSAGSSDGPGPEARFSGSAGLAVDSAGNLYVGDNFNHTLRKGTPSSFTGAPVIDVPPASQSVNAGGSVTFQVIASGSSTLTYQWRHNGVDIGGATAASLTLTNVQTSDAGAYAVLVHSVAEGDVLSAPATLTVTVAPTIDTQPLNQHVSTGQAVNLSVTATDAGDLSYQWRRNGFEIPGAIGSTYTIPAAQRSDADVYDVVINGVGGTRISAPSRVTVAPTSYPGDITADPTYQPNPVTISTRVYAALPLAGGKWLAGGEFVQWDSSLRSSLARLNADLTLDSGYTPPVINGVIYALALAPDGSVYIGGDFTAVDGHRRPGLAKLTPTLTLDLTWQPKDSPAALTQVSALAVQADGKPLVARMSFTTGALAAGNVLRRLNLDGTLDGTFSTTVTLSGTARIYQLIAEPSGAVVMTGAFTSVNSGTQTNIARVDSTGVLDINFGGSSGANNTVNSITRLSDGRFLVGGNFTTIAGQPRNRVAILTTAGAADGSFIPANTGNTNGGVLGAARLSDGRVLIGGTFTSYSNVTAFGLIRLTAGGAFDATFSAGGATPVGFTSTTAGRNLMMFPITGDAVAMFGNFQSVLNTRRVGVAVLNAGVSGDGSLANPPSSLLYRPAYANAAFLQSDGKLTLFGSMQAANGSTNLNQMARFNLDGTVDGTFPAGEGVTLNGLSVFGFYRVVRQSDGKYVGIGDFVSYGGEPANRLVRINADGTRDHSFEVGGGPSNYIVPIYPLAGGKLLFHSIPAGFFYNGSGAVGLLRLNADGSRDTTFNPGTAFGASSAAVVLEQPGSGKIYAAGNFLTYNGVSAPGIVRINADGSLDTTFTLPTAVTGGSISVMTWLRDGRIALGGTFTSYNGTTVNRLAIISADGVLDNTFTADAVITGTVGQVLEQEDGKLIVTGDFPNGPPAYRLSATGAVDNTFALRGVTGWPGNSGSALRLIMDADGQLYAYGATLSLNYGAAQSLLRFNTTPTAPTVTTPPASSIVSLGGSTVLSVRAGGTGPYTYQWRLDGDDIEGATDSVLFLSNITAGQAGNYDVVISNGVSSVTSAAATISLPPTGAGLLWSVGPNEYGMLADGTDLARIAPIAGGVAKIASGGGSNYYLKTDGTLWSVGYNLNGQLGDGSTTNRALAVQIASGVSDVAAGLFHAVFIKTDGTLWGMGSNTNGQLADGTTTTRSSPTLMASGVASAAAGGNHTLYVKTDGTLWGVGGNSTGQLGNGTTAVTQLVPVQITTGVSAVAAGNGYSLILKANGDLMAMGSNSSGQLGDGTTTLRNVPTFVSANVVAMAASHSGSHSLFVKANGDVMGMGVNNQGQLGIGSLTNQSVPVLITTGGSSGAVGATYSLIVKADGTLWSSGQNDLAQLADGTRVSRTTLAQVATGVAKASTGNAFGQYLKSDGTLWTFGYNPFGQRGDGTTGIRPDPVLVAQSVRTISSGGYAYSMYLRSDQTLLGWGWNPSGQQGNGGFTPTNTPTQIDTGVSAHAAGGSHNLYLKTDGTVWAVGSNGAGQFGNGTTAAAVTTPVQVATGMKAIAAAEHSLFLRTDGTLLAAGPNSFGQLGDGSTTNRATPVTIASGVTAIAAAARHSLFLKADGSLWTMGNNSEGQMGIGATASSNVPVLVTTGVSAISAISRHSLFLKTDGTLWAMGRNSNGQVGNNTTTTQTTPVQIATGVVKIAAGTTASLFIKTDGTLWLTGSRYLADGTASNVLAPVQIAAGVIEIASNSTHYFTQQPGYGTAPGISVQPVAATVNAGAYLSLMVTATGSGPLDYQWRKDGTPIPGARDSYYYVHYSQPSDAGDYDVVITNSAGTITSDEVAVEIITIQPQTITFAALPDIAFTTTPITLSASASSGLTVTFAVDAGNATVSGNSLTLTGTGSVTVRASQAGNGSYSAATDVVRTFTVSANFASWREGFFTSGELADANVSGPNAIYGQDGLPNLVKYALGLNPKVNATSGLPEVSTTATHWVYTYTRPAARADLAYKVEYSTNLTSWQEVAGSDHTQTGSAGGEETWQAVYPLASAPNLYFRLKVTQP